MSRPFYEKQVDRDNESRIASILSAHWMCLIRKMKTACELDYSVERQGRLAAVMEIKCRNYTFDELNNMGGLILSAHKWQAAKRWVETHHIDFLLVLGLRNGLFRMVVDKGQAWPILPLVTAGRHDRGDSQDIEPCVLVPMSMFCVVNTKN